MHIKCATSCANNLFFLTKVAKLLNFDLIIGVVCRNNLLCDFCTAFFSVIYKNSNFFCTSGEILMTS